MPKNDLSAHSGRPRFRLLTPLLCTAALALGLAGCSFKVSASAKSGGDAKSSSSSKSKSSSKTSSKSKSSSTSKASASASASGKASGKTKTSAKGSATGKASGSAAARKKGSTKIYSSSKRVSGMGCSTEKHDFKATKYVRGGRGGSASVEFGPRDGRGSAAVEHGPKDGRGSAAVEHGPKDGRGSASVDHKPQDKPQETKPQQPPEPPPVVVIPPPEEPPENVFGYEDPVRGCFEGKVYSLEPNTKQLPTNYRPLGEPLSVVYACEWDIPTRAWEQGFPGVADNFEWFVIKYDGYFNIEAAGEWAFRLSSDDGTRLYIDDELVIDNDGVHPPRVKNGKIKLGKGEHKMRLEYFQGPRYHINLQLYATPPGGSEGVFSVR